jgi:phospholipase A1
MKISKLSSRFSCLFFFFSVNAQIQALFNSKTQLRNMTRWELDTTLRGTFGHLQTYVRVARTMVNQP